MRQLWFMASAIALIAGVLWYGYLEYTNTPKATAPTEAAQRLSEDVYPLYAGVKWNQAEAETFTLGERDYSPGVTMTSLPVVGTMDPASVFAPFERYYTDKLKALGYTVDNGLAAGGHTGGQTAYRHGTSVVITRFKIVYRNVPENAPSECPCDVTLSIFTSGK